MQPVVDDTRQLGILDESDLVDVLALVAAHQQVAVEIVQVRLELHRYESIINAGVVILDLNIVIGSTNGRRLFRLLRIVYAGLRPRQVVPQTNIGDVLQGGLGRMSDVLMSQLLLRNGVVAASAGLSHRLSWHVVGAGSVDVDLVRREELADQASR